MRTRIALLAGALVLGFGAPAPAAATPAPRPPDQGSSSAGSLTVRGTEARKLAKSIETRQAGLKKTVKTVQLTSEPSVLSLWQDETTMGAYVVANAGGDLVSRVWYTDTGWTDWHVERSGITGRPAVDLNVPDWKVDVYAVVDGRLGRTQGPGHWEDLGIKAGGDPVTLLNLTNYEFHVYVVNSTGQLLERIFGGGGTAWKNLGNPGSDTVTPYWNPHNGNVQLYANNGGRLAEKYRDARTGTWSGWTTFPGEIESDPAVVFNPANGNTQVYAHQQTGLAELYWDSRTGRWNGWGNLGGPGSGTAAAFHNNLNGNIQVYAKADGRILEKYWEARTGRWSAWSSLGGTLSAIPTVTKSWALDRVQLIGRTPGGQLTETYWSPGKPWSGWRTIA